MLGVGFEVYELKKENQWQPFLVVGEIRGEFQRRRRMKEETSLKPLQVLPFL